MQTYNSFDSLAAAQTVTPLVSDMSVFNKESRDFKVKWRYAVRNGEPTGIIMCGGEKVGKVELVRTDRMQMCWEDAEIIKKRGEKYESFQIPPIFDGSSGLRVWDMVTLKEEVDKVLAEVADDCSSTNADE